jgi:penicillin-binding protein 2
MDFFNSNLQNELNKRRIKGKFQETIEPQEVLLDKLAQKKEEELGITEKKLEVPLSSTILKTFYFLVILAIILLFFQTFYFQIIQGKNFSQLSNTNSLRIILLRSERGVIYDKNFEQLVSNLPSFDLVLDKRDLPEDNKEREKIIGEVATIIKKNADELRNQIEESKTAEILVLENIPHETLLLLEPKIPELPGFRIEKNTVRNYKDNSIFAHLIGYTGKINQAELSQLENYSISDYIGKTGLEKYYEEVLRGKPGKILIEKDVLGQKRKETQASLPEAGKSLLLYLDAGLQRKITESLSRILRNVGGQAGVGIAMDPRSGGILALVSLPSFDNNLFSQGISSKELQKILNDPKKPFFNRAVSGEYVTGSTIKPLIASAALEEKIITPEKEINCQGVISVPNPYQPEIIYEYHDWKVHGLTDIRKAIAQSCNIFFYTVGGGYKGFKGLGVERIKKYLELFGWGQKLGIDLPEEKSGLIPDQNWKESYFQNQVDKIWYPGDTYHLSIGQGFISATPLQVVTAFAAIANGGKLYQPQVVQKIVDSEKNTIQEFKPKIIRENFINPDNLQIVREGMREGVTYGSSVILNTLPVKAAAKTGTAQTSKQNVYHNWVTVFAPYENPEIVLTIMLENVPGVQAAALPVAREVLEWYFMR